MPLERRGYRPYTWPLFRRLLQYSKRPILVGPWRGEVGFEILYWLPWLEQVRATLHLDAERLLPITRGGALVWYRVPKGLELYQMRTPQQVRVENKIQFAQHHQYKQTHVTAWDRAVLADAAATLGLTRPLVLHPAWMFQMLQGYWKGHQGLSWLQGRIALGPLAPPVLANVQLPEKFLCVRFYARPTWPISEETAAFAKQVIRHLATQVPVILLTPGLHVDDHVDFVPKPIDNVIRMDQLLTVTPENNLAVQSALIGRSVGFVGTYGGLAQLALRLGKASISFYTDWHSTALSHKHLAEALGIGMGVPFQVWRLGDTPALHNVVPAAIKELVGA